MLAQHHDCWIFHTMENQVIHELIRSFSGPIPQMKLPQALFTGYSRARGFS